MQFISFLLFGEIFFSSLECVVPAFAGLLNLEECNKNKYTTLLHKNNNIYSNPQLRQKKPCCLSSFRHEFEPNFNKILSVQGKSEFKSFQEKTCTE